MSSSFYTTNIVDDNNHQSLWDAYDNCPMEWKHQDWNLFNLEKRSMGQSYWKKFDAIHDIDRYMWRNYHVRTHVHYFLKYVPNSSTRIHQDNKDTVTKTVITFLDQSEDLVGGDTLVLDRYIDHPAPPNSTIKGRDLSGQSVIPTVIKVPDYSSLVYDWNVPHGVTRVTQGHRIVLVSWYVPAR